MAEVSAAAREAAMLGASRDLRPVEALLWVIRLATGEVAWLTVKLRENPADVTVREVRGEAMDRLARYSALAERIGAA